MTSETQVAANRENGKLGGVKTEEGKAITRYNAVKHGLTAKLVVARGESPMAFNQLRDNLITELCPQGELEIMLVDRIAAFTWKLRRVAKLEVDGLNDCWDEFGFYHRYYYQSWPTFSRYEITIERQLYKAIDQLERMQRTRRGEQIPAPLAIDVTVSPQVDI